MIQTIALIASIVLPLWNIPLILKIIRRKSSRDVSMSWAVGVWANHVDWQTPPGKGADRKGRLEKLNDEIRALGEAQNRTLAVWVGRHAHGYGNDIGVPWQRDRARRRDRHVPPAQAAAAQVNRRILGQMVEEELMVGSRAARPGMAED